MATGDDNWALLVRPNTLACGCYVGIWHGVTPPPRCAAHTNEGWTWQGVQEPLAPTPTLEELFEGIRRESVTAPSIEERLDEVRERIEQLATVAKESGEVAQLDLWQLALQHLEPLRAAIERARLAGAGGAE